MIVVLDTNVLVSGIFYGGKPKKILDLWALERFTVYATPTILEEYVRVIHDLDQRLRMGVFSKWREVLPEVTHLVPDKTQRLHFCRDPHDDKFLHCAFQSRADYLITGDADLRSIRLKANFKIVSPEQFLRTL